MVKIFSYSSKETILLGKQFSQILEGSDIVILEGTLGGGKTTFVKGVLEGFGFKKKVLSPSFILLRQYRIRKFLIFHLDLYRLGEKDIFGLGLEDVLHSQNSITLIEWGDKIRKYLDKYIKIKFLFLGENSRTLIFSEKGYNKKKIESLKKVFGYEGR